MKKVLFVNSCIRPCSRTFLLAQAVLKKLDSSIEEVNLMHENIPFLNLEHIVNRNNLISAQDFSSPLLQYAVQFASADEIVIAAPYWDLAFPSILKIYLEHVTVAGITFQYSKEGIPMGLCKANRLIYITTAGGPIAGHNFGYDYIKTLANSFYGIPEVLHFAAENLDVNGADVNGILQKAIKKINSSI